MDQEAIEFHSPLFPLPNLEEVRKMLTGGLSTLRDRGWTRGASENEAGQVCAVGGIFRWMKSRYGYTYWSNPQVMANYGKAKRLLDFYASQAAGKPDTFTEDYNDSIATSQAEIEALYEKAIASL